MSQFFMTWWPTAKVVGLFGVYVLLMLAIGHRSQIDAWCEANPRRAGALKLIRGICPTDPFLVIQGLALLILKRLPIGYYQAAMNVVPLPIAESQGVIVTGSTEPVTDSVDPAIDGCQCSQCARRRRRAQLPPDLPPAA
jgi:hypothetical protein